MGSEYANVLALVDRALTTPTRAAEVAAGWSKLTAVAYTANWPLFVAWCRPPGAGGQPPPRWLTPMPCTPETLALYAADLVYEQGRAVATARKAVAGIRAWHRLHGAPVPDGIPALSVLRKRESTLRAAGAGPKPQVGFTLEQTLTVAARLDRSTPAGRRDAALLMLVYAATFTARQIVALRIWDVDEDAAAGLHVRGQTSPARLIPHWGGDSHRPDLCPVETIVDQAYYLAARGAPPNSPLIRAVDALGRTAGLDDAYRGRVVGGGAFTPAGCANALAAVLRRNPDNPAVPYPPDGRTLPAVRLGGLEQRRRQGATVEQLAEHAGLSLRSERALLGMVRGAEARPGGDP